MTKFKVGDMVTDGKGEFYTITKVRFDVDGKPIYHGGYNLGYVLLRDNEVSLYQAK